MPRLALLIFASIPIAACAPTYAPPIHATHFGAPQHASAGDSEVRIGAGAPGGLAGGIELPLGGTVHLELRGEGSSEWVLGSAGLRIDALSSPKGDDLRWLADFGFGGGIGRGGELCGNGGEDANCDGAGAEPDGLAWHRRLAGGGYIDSGLGLEIGGWFVPFVRGSLRLTTATHVPLTFWLSGLIGAEARIDPVAFYLGGGWYAYTNDVDANDGPFLEAGVAVKFN